MQGAHLCRRGRDVGGLGVGHRLDDDRVRAADLHPGDIDDDGVSPRLLGHGFNITADYPTTGKRFRKGRTGSVGVTLLRKR